jgi:hypothetical protein
VTMTDARNTALARKVETAVLRISRHRDIRTTVLKVTEMIARGHLVEKADLTEIVDRPVRKEIAVLIAKVVPNVVRRL